MSNKVVPLIIILVLVGGIVTWGAQTDWTFTGLLPRKCAKCNPKDKVANAIEYIYNDKDECVVVNKCKKDWEPNTSNTACEYSSVGATCTAKTTITNAATYKFGPDGVCDLVKTCKTGWKPSTAAKTCVVNAGAICTPPELDIPNAETYAFDADGKCTLAKTCKTGWKPSTAAKTCVVNAGATCTPPVTVISNATKYNLDADGKCTLVNECNEGFRVSDDSKTCVDEFEPLTNAKPYQMDGFHKVDTTADSGQLWKKTSVEECRKLAKEKDAIAIGVRTSKHGGPAYNKTCWYYGRKWVPDLTKGVHGQESQYVECLDKTKKPSEGCK